MINFLKITVDARNYSERMKIEFIKGIRAYTGEGLKEAKAISESCEPNLVLRAHPTYSSDKLMEGINMIRRAGVIVKSDRGMDKIVGNLEIAAKVAIDIGSYGIAVEITGILQRLSDLFQER